MRYQPAHRTSAMTKSIKLTFRRHGAVWEFNDGREPFGLPHLKGFLEIARLLGCPRQPVHSKKLENPELLVNAAHPGPTDEIVDDAAVRDYQARVRSLEGALSMMTGKGGHSSKERIAGEIEFLARELRKVQGLKGRKRHFPTEDERARVRVTKHIATAIERIAEYSPSLAHHLKASIRTGMYCCYQPPPDDNIEWEL